MQELRPHLVDLADFAARVDGRQRAEGYRLVASFEEGESEAAAVAGFRVTNHLAWGHCLYVDDLSTRASHRRRGHAAALMAWLVEEAKRLGCDELHLDSGHQRHDAHRFYLNHGMDITAHHFRLNLGGPVPKH
jgi:GNAT superfamily N-acetyltransferase